ncbi:hypothetical protein FNV43_RR04043 [Rhamnella rubrinervis]|uniref:Uncharacterized protein n=1 Tax=Rhamnella rubrinervis TaxID=2594499 RepID=A0A8K0HK98_9ROSA|nr:hypothetical protein FNV43_RR04043 [Rhamnella rubrinervis]
MSVTASNSSASSVYWSAFFSDDVSDESADRSFETRGVEEISYFVQRDVLGILGVRREAMVGAIKRKVGKISDEAEELETMIVERMYWMLREVVAMVTVKLEALCLICLASSRNRIRWPCLDRVFSSDRWEEHVSMSHTSIGKPSVTLDRIEASFGRILIAASQ